MSRILIAGAGGMTGSALAQKAREAGWDVFAPARGDLDITDADAVVAAMRAARPHVVVNAAAYTAVDAAESARDEAMRVNRDGAANLAQASGDAGAAIVHISTDYVFDGDRSRPYVPGDAVNPLSAYGESKLAGEVEVRARNASHVIVRSSWVYSDTGKNFLTTMLRLAGETRDIRVVDDQQGSPTSAADLAAALLRVATVLVEPRDISGTYHFTNSGSTTWYGFASAIFEELKLSPTVHAVATKDFPTAATRPRYSVLDGAAFTREFGMSPRPWRDALRSTLELM